MHRSFRFQFPLRTFWRRGWGRSYCYGVSSLLMLMLLSAAQCAPAPTSLDGSGDASLTLISSSSSTDFVHDPSLSSVTLTPPVEGLLVADFVYQDPPMSFSLTLDTSILSEGQSISFPLVQPLSSSSLFFSVRLNGAEFTSNESVAGSVDIATLAVDDVAAAASISVSFDVTLLDSTGQPLSAIGFIEGSVQ